MNISKPTNLSQSVMFINRVWVGKSKRCSHPYQDTFCTQDSLLIPIATIRPSYNGKVNGKVLVIRSYTDVFPERMTTAKATRFTLVKTGLDCWTVSKIWIYLLHKTGKLAQFCQGDIIESEASAALARRRRIAEKVCPFNTEKKLPIGFVRLNLKHRVFQRFKMCYC